MNIEMEKVESLEKASIIIDFQKAMAFETEGLRLDDQSVNQGVRAVISDPQKGTYYLAHKGGIALGSLLLIPEWSDWRNKTVLWIHSVYLRPEFRSQGIFRHMYQYLQEMIERDDSYAGLRLFVDKRNIKAKGVYEALGMSNEHYELYEWLQ